MTAEACDVLVVGGGPSGAIAAAALAGADHHVVLLEADRIGRRRPAELLPPAMVRQLSMAGADAPSSGAAIWCRGVVSRWGREEPQMMDYELLSCGPGWIVARPALDRLLLRQAAQSGADIRLGCRCLRVIPSATACLITIATPDGIMCAVARAVVDATGRSGGWSGQGRVYHDRQLAYVWTCKRPGGTLLDCVWVESRDDAWCYASPLPNGDAQFVWITDTRPRRPGEAGLSEALKAAFESTETIRHAFAPDVTFEAPFVCDARLSASSRHVRTPVFRVGDALAPADPLSGRGWAQAWRSALDVAEMVHDFLGRGRSAQFERYQAKASEHIRGILTRRSAYQAAHSSSRRTS